MRRLRIVAVLATAVLLSVVFGACSNDDDGDAGSADTTSSSSSEKLTFYSVIHSPTGDPFWAVYYKGAEDAAKQMNVDVKQLAPKQASIPEMVDLLNSAVDARPDGILTTVADAKAEDRVLRRAIDQGIPVIALNTPDTRPEGERVPYLTYIGGDERLGGERAAEYMLEERTPKAAVCVIHNTAQSGLVARCDGFTKRMEAAGVSADTLPVDTTDPTKISETVRSYLTSHGDTDAIFTLGPDPANAVSKALKEAGKSDIMHGSYDLSTDQTSAIEGGELLFTIDQQQYLQTYLGVVMLAQSVRHGFTPAADILTGPAIVDKSNVEDVVAGVDAQFR